MSKVSIIASALLLSAAAVSSAQTITPEHKARAAELVKQMTLEEKCNYLGGYRDGFHIRPVERLGIPEIGMAASSVKVDGQPCEFENKDTAALISLPQTPADTRTIVEIVLK